MCTVHAVHTLKREACNVQQGGSARVDRMDEKCLKSSNATQEIEEVERVFSGLKVASPKARLGIEKTHVAKETNDSELGFLRVLYSLVQKPRFNCNRETRKFIRRIFSKDSVWLYKNISLRLYI